MILSPVDLNTETSCVDNCSDTFEVVSVSWVFFFFFCQKFG